MSNEWRQFFDQVASEYDNEIFTRNSLAEVDFICEELQLKEGDSILDIGCGTGRHSIELARRGFKVTGVDMSGGMLEIARRKAREAGVEIELIQSAAQDFVAGHKYSAVVSLCEGALCLFNEEDNIWAKDMAIFASIAGALEPGSPFLITVLNAFAMIRRLSNADVAAGKADLFTLTTRNATEVKRNGIRAGITGIERYYTPSELVRMVNRVGLKVDRVYGGTAGNWGRRSIDLDEIELMVIGHCKDHKGRS
jgi:SAM-dependent methyltransferase